MTILLTMGLATGLEVLRPWPTKLVVDQVLGQQPLPAGLSRLVAALPGPAGVAGLLLWVCVSVVLIFLAGSLVAMVNTSA